MKSQKVSFRGGDRAIQCDKNVHFSSALAAKTDNSLTDDTSKEANGRLRGKRRVEASTVKMHRDKNEAPSHENPRRKNSTPRTGGKKV